MFWLVWVKDKDIVHAPAKADMHNFVSEIPCRVSSDLHERRNDWNTVSTTDPVKL
jgi:hypothetical protein